MSESASRTSPGLPVHRCMGTDSASELEFIAALDDFVLAQLRAQRVPGLNLAIGRGGRCIYAAGYGYADVAARRAQTPQTVFRSGSMGKTYTGIAIMQLADAGVLQLDDRAGDLLGFPLRNPLSDTDITLRQLMTHSSGLTGDAAGTTLGAPQALERIVRDTLAEPHHPGFGGLPLWSAAPGVRHFYSNLGVGILGLVVERANPAGLSYCDWVQSRIIEALDMKMAQYPAIQTADRVRPDIWQACSTGYCALGTRHLPTPAIHIGNYPAGGLMATPGDHLQLLLAMLGGGSLHGRRILSEAAVAQMLCQQFPGILHKGSVPLPRERQGLIWRLRDVDDIDQRRHGWAFHHGGGHMFGWQTQGIAWPQFDLAYVSAVNQWSPLVTARVLDAIDDFISTWYTTAFAAPAFSAHHADHARDVAYLQGLLLAGALQTILCTAPTSDPDMEHLLAASGQVDGLDYPDLPWDAEAFQAGVRDLWAVAATREAYQAFFAGGHSRVPLDRARAINAELTAGQPAWGSLLGVLADQAIVT